MAVTQATSVAATHLATLQALALLGLSFIPWAPTRTLIDSARSPELNRAEREIHAAGYYEGLIGGDDGAEGARGELTLRLMGKPSGWVQFNDANVSRPNPADFLQFDLQPGIRRMLFGKPFVTNSHGMHSDEVALEKPPGTFRIALLGSSMDMGWGVTCEESYAHRLQDWLNHHAKVRGLDSGRRFEVLNFAIAAYSPLQRLESFRRKARAFRPDMVLFAATMLDLRLMEIHVCNVLQNKADPTFDFLRETFDRAGVSADQLAINARGKVVNKNDLKARLNPYYWELYDQALGALAGDCRAEGIPLVMAIIPRVGKADAPDARAEPVARLKAIAAHHAVPAYDLSDSFDRFDPATLEIAAWDDHPNALGHHRLFLALGRTLARDEPRYRLLFPGPSPPGPPANQTAEPAR